MGVVWLSGGSLSPLEPQTVANHAYRELWSHHWEGPNGAIEMFRQALAMDPAFPYRWSDLGDALAAAGRADSARYCFRRSVELAPNSPQIAMRASNFYLREGETGTALGVGATVLRVTTAYDNMVFNSWVRLGGDTNEILQSGIGTNARAAEAFFRFLIGANDESRLFQTWKWMESRSYVTRPAAALWAGWLSGRHRDNEAFPIWKRYVALDSTYGVSNWIDNSGFENEPTGQGFDWRIQPSPGVTTALDTSVVHSGRSSLRIEFDGSENVDYHHIGQRVWLPSGRYRLAAWMRTADLSTDQGLTLVLNGVSTPALTGTHDWTRVSADITVRNDTPLGEVQVVRQRSWRFDGGLRGVAWIDDVELRRID
jgi:tetratricopeptide (TPR) repeat protein